VVCVPEDEAAEALEHLRPLPCDSDPNNADPDD
jgi:hypothetical protein